ncbi:nicotinate-nucleotide diphosphorylase (carboxylating) [Xaviernesmea oryzae]|uniref:Probable nicotinate-nucleotide pyrophosphorylase [carboxylating] n=1 Tax=Xaviernesmea oryzae TaxID=464029 RepID=A0A1Q9AT37_9HYPH|nr:carboxylating nicotinate-nucleotide diphosphorylase [Xaviernesmea oryzae]OLP58583.1 nicotinate-nucleotide diphosphorylase (carboxylating) [Xaviernesmea oryzae]SEK63177.1 nicotinate-nucleotide pyrophosphorylase [carboxylating] [Xaviernesmea oryzae]
MTHSYPPELPDLLVEAQVRAALVEDLGRAGDVTTLATIGPEAQASAVLSARDPGVLAGLTLARAAFGLVDPAIRFETALVDGAPLVPGTTIATVSGRARGLLSAERVALNYLMHLSGVASLTARYAHEIAHTHARITCTRKTLPGLRALEKYAVKLGGGSNHRFGLDDAILIKDNHIAVAGGIAPALAAARAYAGHLMRIEIEVDTLDQFSEALDAGADVVLLDNMTPDRLAEAVAMNAAHHGLVADGDYAHAKRRTVLEASGNVSLSTVRAIAEAGVDFISTSKITMAAPTLDIGLDMAIA